jgi:hypothetical protein
MPDSFKGAIYIDYYRNGGGAVKSFTTSKKYVVNSLIHRFRQLRVQRLQNVVNQNCRPDKRFDERVEEADEIFGILREVNKCSDECKEPDKTGGTVIFNYIY